MIEILTKIQIPVKITIIVAENRELYYCIIIIISKCKDVPLSLFSYQMLASTLTMDEWSIYSKVFDRSRASKLIFFQWLVILTTCGIYRAKKI